MTDDGDLDNSSGHIDGKEHIDGTRQIRRRRGRTSGSGQKMAVCVGKYLEVKLDSD